MSGPTSISMCGSDGKDNVRDADKNGETQRSLQNVSVIGDTTVGDVGGNVSMYDISMYGGDKKNLTKKERMKRRARKMIKAGLREDQCFCCSLEGSPTTACLIIACVVFLIILCLVVFALMSAGIDFEATFAEPGVHD